MIRCLYCYPEHLDAFVQNNNTVCSGIGITKSIVDKKIMNSILTAEQKQLRSNMTAVQCYQNFIQSHFYILK